MVLEFIMSFCEQKKKKVYPGVQDDGSHAGIKEEVQSGMGVAPPEVDACKYVNACGGLKDWCKWILAFDGWKSMLQGFS